MEVQIGDNTYKIEEGLFYTKAHQWAKLEAGFILIGLSDFAQEQLGEISLVELSSLDAGQALEQVKFDGNDPASEPIPDVSIESSKTVADLYSPVSGTLDSVNEALEDEPEKVNEAPYEAWLLKIKPSNWESEKANLMDANAYIEFLKTL